MSENHECSCGHVVHEGDEGCSCKVPHCCGTYPCDKKCCRETLESAKEKEEVQ